MSDSPRSAAAYERWCGICFYWRAEQNGRCASCGNAHMTGESIPRPATATALHWLGSLPNEGENA